MTIYQLKLTFVTEEKIVNKMFSILHFTALVLLFLLNAIRNNLLKKD